MNDLYNETITRRGRIYQYDPDSDCYYPKSLPMSTWNTWSPVVVVLLLSAIAIYMEFYYHA